jgi:hypothetical protein
MADISHMTFTRQQRRAPHVQMYGHPPRPFKCKMPRVAVGPIEYHKHIFT